MLPLLPNESLGMRLGETAGTFREKEVERFWGVANFAFQVSVKSKTCHTSTVYCTEREYSIYNIPKLLIQ